MRVTVWDKCLTKFLIYWFKEYFFNFIFYILRCNIGDAVLVVWDESSGNYIIFQDSTTLYFLHSDCLDTLQLRPPTGNSAII